MHHQVASTIEYISSITIFCLSANPLVITRVGYLSHGREMAYCIGTSHRTPQLLIIWLKLLTRTILAAISAIVAITITITLAIAIVLLEHHALVDVIFILLTTPGSARILEVTV